MYYCVNRERVLFFFQFTTDLMSAMKEFIGAFDGTLMWLIELAVHGYCSGLAVSRIADFI